MIFTSKLESAKIFMKWVTSEVLPSIRKRGSYVMPISVGHKFNNALTFKMENENDLHIKVVSFLKKRFPHSIFVTSLGENQDTSIKRIDSFNNCYMKGTPDLIINNLHRYYTGFAIEFKTPKGYGTLSYEQSNILFHYQLNGLKTLASNDYNRIVEELLVYNEADDAYSIRSTWSCYWLDQFLTLALNILILSIFYISVDLSTNYFAHFSGC